MNFDSASLEKLRRMDAETLKSTALQIAAIVGADPGKTKELLSDPTVLQTVLRGLTPEQAGQMLSQVGEEKALQICALLGKGR